MQSIRILGIDYDEETRDFEEEDTIGESCEQLCKIWIRPGLKRDLHDEAVLHEVMHQVNQRLAIGLNEDQVQRLSSGLYCVSKENNIQIILPNSRG
jgi:hypothetical protein